MVRTPAFQAGNAGSIPAGDTMTCYTVCECVPKKYNPRYKWNWDEVVSHCRHNHRSLKAARRCLDKHQAMSVKYTGEEIDLRIGVVTGYYGDRYSSMKEGD